MIAALRRAAHSALALLVTRAEFASVELSLAREQAMRWLLMALTASVLAMLGLIALSAALVVALWDRFGWYAVAALALLYCASAAVLVARLLYEVAHAPPLLAQTFAELAQDRAALQGRPGPHGESNRAP
jgi:uncharacterized membrane protein YqjE